MPRGHATTQGADVSDEPTAQDWRQPFRRLAVGAALALAVVAGFLAFSLWTSHQRYQAAAADNLQNLTLNLERYLFTRLQAADLVLQSAAQEFRRLSGQGPVRAEQFTEVLIGLQQRLPEAPALRAAEADGLVKFGAGANAQQALNIAQRHFFKQAVNAPGLVLGLPLKSRITSRWVLPIARQLRDSSGALAGVVYLNMDLDELGGIMRSLRVGERGVITVFNTDREVLLRLPEVPLVADEKPVRLASPETQQAVASAQAAGGFETRSTIDGQMRTVMYRQLGRYPAYVLIGLEQGELMAPWQRELTIAVAFWLCLVAGIAALLGTQYRAARHRAAVLRELEAARERAEAASRSKSMFLANMSHEIRTPLNGVLGFAQIGYRDLTSSPEVRSRFGRILESGKLLQGILNDVLDMSKIEAGKLLLDESLTPLRPIAQRALDLVRQAAADKGVGLHLLVDDRVPAQLRVDGLRLGQVLLNLLSNAVKFTDAGEVSLSLQVDHGELLVEVSDSGVGMSAEQVGRLFVSFEQADPSTTRRYGGTGLGLAISKRLVELMKGSIRVSSRSGEGSVFCVRLPLAGAMPAGPSTAGREAVAERGEVGEPVRERLAGLQVLVAEDNIVNQIVIQSLLESEGAQADIVGDGHLAVARVSTPGVRYDVVLLDVMMPGIDGYETARRIHALYPQLPIIGQTAHALPEEHAHCIASGMVDRVTKPIDADELVRVVLRHCGSREVRAAR
jgi:signal transduction histidine kinase/ActR/RegA family two-component response regulator